MIPGYRAWFNRIAATPFSCNFDTAYMVSEQSKNTLRLGN